MNSFELSELIEEFNDVEIYDVYPKDWMGYLQDDNYCMPIHELAY